MLLAAFRRSDALFSLLDTGAHLERPIALWRFAWNQNGRGALGQGRLHPEVDILFEQGIDAASAQAASKSAWPLLDEVLAYPGR